MARAIRDKKSRREQRAIDEQQSAGRWRMVGAASALAVLCIVAYVPVLGSDFVTFDDVEGVLEQPAYNPPALRNLGQFWTKTYPDLYTPILWTVWGVLAFVARTEGPNGAVWDATPYHAFNLAAHIAAAVMALIVLRRLVPSARAAFVGAALFALHPIQVEAVAWVAGMKTPLSGAFTLWAVWHYLRFSDLLKTPTVGTGSRRKALAFHIGLGTFAYLLALITKPTVVVLPIIVGVIELLLRGRGVRDLWPMLGWLVLSVVFGLINVSAQPAETVFRPPAWARLLISFDSLSFYLWKLVAPIGLLPDYARTPEWVTGRPSWWWGAVPAIALLVAAALLVRKAPWVTAPVAIFSLGAAATLGFIPYDYQVYSTVADRYAYLSMFGAAIAVAIIVNICARRRNARAVWVVAGCVLVACAVLTFRQCQFWKDTTTLFTYTLERNPRSLVAYRSLAFQATMQRRTDEALEIAQKGLLARPGDPLLLQFVGNVAMQKGQFNEAANAFRASTEKPSLIRHLGWMGLGAALAQAGRFEEAEKAFNDVLADKPDFAVAYENLGVLNAQQGRWDAAIVQFSRALRIDPNLPRSAGLRQQIRAMRDAGTLPPTRPTSPATAPSP